MEKSIITTGKTIDEAVEAALRQLGLTRDDVTYQVISLPKSGFFGIGAVPAKVQVTYEAPDLKPAAPKADAAPRAEKKPEAASKPEPKPETAAPRIALSSASRSKPKAAKPAAPKAEAPKPVEKKPEPKAETPKVEKKSEPKPAAPKAEKKSGGDSIFGKPIGKPPVPIGELELDMGMVVIEGCLKLTSEYP